MGLISLEKIVYSIILLFLSSLLYIIFIPILTKLKFGQVVRDDGPKTHLKKYGTPTMGGLVMIVCFAIAFLFIYKNNIFENFELLITLLGFGIIGFLDDYLKIIKKNPKGLKAKYKLLLQLIFSIYFLYCTLIVKENFINIPFFNVYYFKENNYFLNFLIFILMVLFITGVNNGVNFTDGLDGLCGSVTIVISIFYIFISIYYKMDIDLFLINYIMLILLISFLIFNKYPAKIFMGDTGSLFLGAYVATMAIKLNCVFLIFIYGFIYFFEVVSVILQVSYFKMTKGKRLFKMAPIHHHFEKLGFSENKIVLSFTLITIVLCIVSFLLLGGIYGK